MRVAAVRNWQLISYGNTLHGFTNPDDDGSIMRAALYSTQADRRSPPLMGVDAKPVR
jgi:hypothetical protein